jgi:exonuclease SbcC
MRLDKIKLENFLTYKELEYDFSRSPLLVQGKNLTEEDQESNGSGKSGIFSGIEFCIAASNSRDVRDQELVMFGEKEARTQLYASCDVRKQTIHIDWTIKVKGSNKLSLNVMEYGGEWKEISFSNVNDGKKYILDWFAIEKEDLFNYYIINKSRFKTFFKASNKEKVELINRFSDASIIDGLDKIDNTNLQTEYDTIKSNIDKVDGKVELIGEQIAEEKTKDVDAENENVRIRIKDEIEDAKDIQLDVLEEIKEFEEKLASDKKELKDLESQLVNLESKVTRANELVSQYKSQDYDSALNTVVEKLDLQGDLYDEQDNEIAQLDEKSLKLGKLIKELDIELSGAIVCPSCSTEFTLDCKHGTLDEVKAKLDRAKQIEIQIEDKKKSHSDVMDSISEKMGSLNDEIVKINESRDVDAKQKQLLITAFNKATTDVQMLNKNILRLEGDVNEHKKDIADCEADIKKLDLSIKSLNSDLKNVGANTSVINTDALEASLQSLKTDKVELESNLDVKGDEIYKRNQWANNFKQFRSHLAKQSLEAIEFHMNRYLVGMESDLKVKLEGFKMLANGTFKEDITAKIIRNVERTFSSFSGGEQGRLLFAAILANRHMINSTHKYGGLDFLSIDEVFEGVDSLGLKKLVKSAKQLDIAVMIITHVTDEEVNDDILLIEKINGISYVKTKE